MHGTNSEMAKRQRSSSDIYLVRAIPFTYGEGTGNHSFCMGRSGKCQSLYRGSEKCNSVVQGSQ